MRFCWYPCAVWVHYSSSPFDRLENRNTTAKTASPIVKNTAIKSTSASLNHHRCAPLR